MEQEQQQQQQPQQGFPDTSLPKTNFNDLNANSPNKRDKSEASPRSLSDSSNSSGFGSAFVAGSALFTTGAAGAAVFLALRPPVRVQERYGIAKDEAEKQLAAWEHKASDSWFN